jgi:CBS domain-containing protein
MTLIREVIEKKSLQELITVQSGAPLVEAAGLMARWNVGALLVLEDDAVVGIISERDFVRTVAALGRPFSGVMVNDIMSRAVRLIPGDLTVENCMALMTHLRLRHLPVEEDGEVIGIISLGDLVKETISEQSFLIEQLEAYITRSANA